MAEIKVVASPRFYRKLLAYHGARFAGENMSDLRWGSMSDSTVYLDKSQVRS